MKKKPSVVLCLLAALLSLAGCGRKVITNVINTPNPSLNEEDAAVKHTLNGWMMGFNGSSILLCSDDSSDLYWVSTDNIPISSSDGSTLSFGDMQPGMTVRVSYYGDIIETYPLAFSGISRIVVTGTRTTLVPLYLEALDDVKNISPSLTDGIKLMAFDLTDATNLTDTEKNAFIYLAGLKYGLKTFISTYTQLVAQGYIESVDKNYFDNGVMIVIDVSPEARDNGFNFSINEWRGEYASASYLNCTATKSGSSWSYDHGDAWHS